MTFAIIQTGGKQYKVVSGQKLRIEKLNIKSGETVSFDDVLLVADGDKVEICTPTVKDARVEAEVLGEGRERKK